MLANSPDIRKQVIVLLLTVGGVLAMSAGARASILWDVQFSAGGSNVQTGSAVLGSGSDPAWNSLTGGNGTDTTVTDTTGANPITVTYGTNGSSYTDNGGSPMDPGTTNLMASYIYAHNDASNPTFTVSGLADNATYTLVLYGAGDQAGQGDPAIDVNSSLFGSTTAADRMISNGPGDAYAIGTVTSDGSGNLVVTTGNPSNYSAINGFQLQSVPEPASVMLCGMGILGLLAIARRRRKV